jgi:hypothetical protein
LNDSHACPPPRPSGSVDPPEHSRLPLASLPLGPIEAILL